MWNKRPGAILKQRSMLVWDMFRTHITDDVIEEAKSLKTDLCIIPGGLMSMLQPLDMCLNKLFKDHLRQIWTAWIMSGLAKTTKGGNLQKPDITLICQWVIDVWASIPSEMIVKAFLKCGISNAMDGSQDEAVYEEDDDEVEEDVTTHDDDENNIYKDDGEDYSHLLDQLRQ